MGTRSVRLEEDTYERIRAHKRDDETFSETIERLIGCPSLLELAGILTDEEAAEFRAAVEDADAVAREDVDDIVEQFERNG